MVLLLSSGFYILADMQLQAILSAGDIDGDGQVSLQVEYSIKVYLGHLGSSTLNLLLSLSLILPRLHNNEIRIST